jgi:hypothetical protein
VRASLYSLLSKRIALQVRSSRLLIAVLERISLARRASLRPCLYIYISIVLFYWIYLAYC